LAKSAKPKRLDWIARLDEIFVPAPGQIIKTLSPEWWQARRGRLTASTRASVIGNMKPNSLRTLIAKLQDELSPDWVQTDGYSGQATERGNKLEPQAIADVEFETASETYEPGLVFHPDRPYCSATPDFFIGSDITGQIKCPLKEEFHLDFVHNRKIPSGYMWQIQWEAWCARRPKILFVSFDPRQPMATRSAIIPVDANPVTQALFESNTDRFKEIFETGTNPADVNFGGFHITGSLPNIF
jgi:hypothetical protein